MESSQQHSMKLAMQYPSGAEEWFCPVCGRRLIVQWPPAYHKIILFPGDEEILHSGTSFDDQPDASAKQDQPGRTFAQSFPLISEENLAPWIQFIEELNIEDMLDRDSDCNGY